MSHSKNLSKCFFESGNEGISSFSESQLVRVFSRNEVRAISIRKIIVQKVHLAKEKKENEVVASEIVNHRIGQSGWCSCGNCREKSRKFNFLCFREADTISDEEISGKRKLSKLETY